MAQFNAEEFRVKFRAAFAVLGFIAAMLFIFVAVLSKDAQTSKYTGTIIGFMTGTLVTLVFTYYFGSSDGSITMPETSPNDPALIQLENDLIERENKVIEQENELIDHEELVHDMAAKLQAGLDEQEGLDTPYPKDDDETDEEATV